MHIHTTHPLPHCLAGSRNTANTAYASAWVSLALLLSLGAAPAAYAQGQGAQDPVVEEIVVTGSRIPVNPVNAQVPLIGIDRTEIEDAGSIELSEVLLDYPGIATNLNTSNSQAQGTNAGVSSIQLRGLGSNRTLVLIDGRRVVSNSANAYRVSQSTIPSDFIDRIEIITGAASAIYGSDAIAGVVNYITEDDFEGFEVGSRMERTQYDGRKEDALRATFGRRFLDDRAYLLIAASADRRGELKGPEVPSTQLELLHNYDCQNDPGTLESGQRLCINEFYSFVDGETDFQPASRYLGPDADLIFSQDLRHRSLSTPGGRFFDGGGGGGVFWYDENGLQCELDMVGNCQTDRYQRGLHGYYFKPQAQVTIPRDRLNISAKFNYDINDSLTWNNTLMFSEVDTMSRRTPEPFSDVDASPLYDPETEVSSNIILGPIPRSNPFVPEVARNRDIEFDTRRPEVGPQRSVRESKTWRFTSALDGSHELLNRLWDWQASLSYGRHDLHNVRHNEINLVNLKDGLNAEVHPDNQDTYRCIDAEARARGCIPVNLFGENSLSREAADWIRADLTLESEIEQTVVMAYATTPALFDLPYGPVGMAIGFEWREDEMVNRNDPLSRFGGHTSIIVPDADFSIDVTEFFAEFSVPLLADLPFAELLTATASVRWSDYSLANIGQETTVASGLSWRPVHWLLIRTRYGQAVRAPDLNEAFSPLRGDNDSFNDPCDGIGRTGGGVLGDNCRSIDGIQAAIEDPSSLWHDDNDTPDYPFDDKFNASPSSYSPNSGNEALSAETAESLTAGFVLQPWDWLEVELDWYDIAVEDAIDALDHADILGQCYEDPNAFANQIWGVSSAAGMDGVNVRCLDVYRDLNGNLHTVIQRELNLQQLRVTGWDLGLDVYVDQIVKLPGELTLSGRLNRIKRDEEKFVTTAGVVERKSTAGIGNPRNAAYLRLTWQHHDLRLRWAVSYTGSVRDDIDRLQDYREQVAIAVNAGLAPEQYPERPLYLFFDSYMEHDFAFSWRSRYADTNLRWYGGINNVFDQETPIVPSGDPIKGRSSNYADPWGPPLGRYYYLGLEVNWDFE